MGIRAGKPTPRLYPFDHHTMQLSTYKSWAATFVDHLATAARVAISMNQLRGKLPEFAPELHELGYLDITRPDSGLCKLIRRGIKLGLFTEADLDCLKPEPHMPVINWKE